MYSINHNFNDTYSKSSISSYIKMHFIELYLLLLLLLLLLLFNLFLLFNDDKYTLQTL